MPQGPGTYGSKVGRPPKKSTPTTRRRAEYGRMQAYMDEEERKRDAIAKRQDEAYARHLRTGELTLLDKEGKQYVPPAARAKLAEERAERGKGWRGRETELMIGAAETAMAPFGAGALSKMVREGIKGGAKLLRKAIINKAGKKKGPRRMIPEREQAVFNRIGAQRPGAKTNRNPLAPKKKPLQTTKPVGDGKGTFELRGAQRKAMDELKEIDPKVWASNVKTAPKPAPKKSTIGEAFTKSTKPVPKKVPAGKKSTIGEAFTKRPAITRGTPKPAPKKVGSRGSTVTTDPKTGVRTMRDAKGKVIAKKVPAGKDGPPSTIGKRPGDIVRKPKPQVKKIDRGDTIETAAKITARNKKAVLQKAAEKKAELRGYGTGPGGKLTAAEKAKISADLNKKGVEGYKEILKESGATGGKGRMSKFDAFLKGIFREEAKKKGLPLNRPGAGKSSKRVTRGPWKPTPSPRFKKRGGGGSKGSKSPGN